MNIKRSLKKQFGNPSGILGAFIGWLMSVKNKNRIDHALTILNVKPEDNILEIGYGPGIAIKEIADQLTLGHITGIDRSPVMLRQATKRNKEPIEKGKAKLVLGSHKQLGNVRSYDKILTINVSLFWKDPVETLSELRQFLKPGGFILIVYELPFANSNEEVYQAGKQLFRELAQAGYCDIDLKLKKLNKFDCIYIKGYNPLTNNIELVA